jgi:putative endonuclease
VLKALVEWLRRREASGAKGERVASRYLRAIGYRIVARNVRVRLGLSPKGRRIWGEIDIVAYDGETLAFVEVKSRRVEGRFPVEAAVDARKRRLVAEAARRYRRLMNVTPEPFRFDVVSVVMPDDAPPRVTLTRGYFALPSRHERQELGER